MKLRIVLVAVVWTLLATFASAVTFTTQSFAFKGDVSSEGLLTIEETIDLTFTTPSHGIVRTIPIRVYNAKAEQHPVVYELQYVTQNTAGTKQPANAVTSIEGEDFKIRIGSPDKFVTGKVQYVIAYTVRGAVTDMPVTDAFGKRTELIWNAFKGWPTNIDKATVLVNYPSPYPKKVWIRAMLGFPGHREGIEFHEDNKVTGRKDLLNGKITGNSVSLTTQRQVMAGESVAFDVALPEGTVKAMGTGFKQAGPEGWTPTGTAEPQAPASGPQPVDIITLILPLLSLPAIFAATYKNWKRPQPPVQPNPDIPVNLEPMLCGLLIDGVVDRRDILAGIISLGQKGALKLTSDVGQGMTIELLGEPKSPATEFEQTLLSHLQLHGPVIGATTFGGLYLSLYARITLALKDYRERNNIVAKLSPSPNALAATLLLYGVVVGFVAVVESGPMAAIPVALSFILGFWMIAKVQTLTPYGLQIQSQIKGLKEYLRLYEGSLSLQDFEKYLPYAVAFGYGGELSKALDGTETSCPDWYQPSDGMLAGALWSSLLWNDMSSQNSTLSASGGMPFDSFGSDTSSDSGLSGSFDSSSGSFDGGFSAGDGGGGGGADSW